MRFEANYFITPAHKLFKLSGKKTHGEWIRENYPEFNNRETLCQNGWVVIRTYSDRHAIQTYGLSHTLLRTLQESLCELPRKDMIVIQTAPMKSYQLLFMEFIELETVDQLWRHTDFYGVRRGI